MIVKTLEATLVYLNYLLLYSSWRVDFLDSVSTLVSAASHNVFLHLELQAAVITNETLVFTILVLSQHEGRIAFLTQMALTMFSELLKHFVLREKVVV